MIIHIFWLGGVGRTWVRIIGAWGSGVFKATEVSQGGFFKIEVHDNTVVDSSIYFYYSHNEEHKATNQDVFTVGKNETKALEVTVNTTKHRALLRRPPDTTECTGKMVLLP